MRKLKRDVHHKAQPRRETKSSTGQTRRTRHDIPPGAPPEFGSRRAELERMIRQRFPEGGKEERIRKSLKALEKMRENPLCSNLDIQTVKKIAGDPDLWDY
jgi:hypothetical protein